MKESKKTDVALLMPSAASGGTQRVMINVARGLLAYNIGVTFLICDARGDMMSEIPSECKIVDFRKYQYRGDLKILASINLIRRFVKEHPSTVVLGAPGLAGTALAFLKSRNLKSPMVAIVDNRCTLLKDGSIYHTMVYYTNRILFRNLDAVIAAHHQAADEQVKFFHIEKEKVHTIYHPLVDMEEVDSAEAVHNHHFFKNNTGIKVLLAVGRLVAEKDFACLLKAFEIVHRQREIRLIILGDGPLRNELENQRNLSDYSEDINIYGYTNKVIGFMKRADLFVLSSKEEAFGNVLVEAMSCGKPCIATDCDSGGPREILNYGDSRYGLICPKENPQELANAICKALDMSFSPSIIKERAHFFTIAKSAQQYKNLIERLQ